jgi:uncharacterized protein (DUF427 family)
MMLPETNPAPGFQKHPDHKVDVSNFAGTIVVMADGTEVARSNSALLVEETNHAPVYYLPLEDVDRAVLKDSHHVTRCPFKGKARYWNIRIGNHEIDNALWGYEMPYDEVLELAGMVAFYSSKVAISTEVKS